MLLAARFWQHVSLPSESYFQNALVLLSAKFPSHRRKGQGDLLRIQGSTLVCKRDAL